MNRRHNEAEEAIALLSGTSVSGPCWELDPSVGERRPRSRGRSDEKLRSSKGIFGEEGEREIGRSFWSLELDLSNAAKT